MSFPRGMHDLGFCGTSYTGRGMFGPLGHWCSLVRPKFRKFSRVKMGIVDASLPAARRKRLYPSDGERCRHPAKSLCPVARPKWLRRAQSMALSQLRAASGGGGELGGRSQRRAGQACRSTETGCGTSGLWLGIRRCLWCATGKRLRERGFWKPEI